MDVAGVDELSAVLGDLSAVEIAGAPASTPDPIARLVHGDADAGSGEPVRGGEPGEAAADHRDVVIGGSASRRRDRSVRS
jgi:hypothetical protein